MKVFAMKKISEKNVYRLIVYKTLLEKLLEEGRTKLYSYELAKMASISPEQVRRDLMVVGYSGSPAHGYNIRELYDSIGVFVDPKQKQKTILIGIGNLGKAILDHFPRHNPKLTIVGIFDNSPEKIDRVIHGYHSYHIDKLEQFVKENSVDLVIITVPVESAQQIADVLSNTNIKGILNFSPVQLQIHNKNIFVERVDMMVSLQKVAYMANNK